MSNKTQLQTNNTALDALITRVNAAKDVAASLSEAGGGGGISSGPTVGTFVVTGNGMYEPGSNMYTLTNDSLDIYNRTCVLLTDDNNVAVGLYRTDINNDFRIQTMAGGLFSIKYSNHIQGPSTIQVVGTVSGEVGFLAW